MRDVRVTDERKTVTIRYKGTIRWGGRDYPVSKAVRRPDQSLAMDCQYEGEIYDVRIGPDGQGTFTERHTGETGRVLFTIHGGDDALTLRGQWIYANASEYNCVVELHCTDDEE